MQQGTISWSDYDMQEKCISDDNQWWPAQWLDQEEAPRSDQSLSHVRLFVTPCIAACQASLSITDSRSSLRLTSIKSVMPSSHLILCRPPLLLSQSLPASESFPMSQLFAWGGQNTGVSALASFLSKKSQLPKPKYALIKGHGHCLVVCCSSDPRQLSESQQNHYIWDVRSGNQWDSLKMAMPTADTDQQKEPSFSLWQCPTTCHTTTASKVEWIGLQSLASSAVYTRPLANRLRLQASQLFLEEMLPQPAGGRRCFPTVHKIPKHGFLCYRNKQTYFSLAKMCWF